jgi:F-type H+-transporting ATPase subunit a
MYRKILVLIIGIISVSGLLYSNENTVEEKITKNDTIHHEIEKEKFNAGKLIFEHIGDSHSWHIFSYKDKHIAIPLPVIVYSKTKGLNIFLSNKFHHGHQSYKGFSLPEEGEYKGKIIEQNPDGTISLPLDFSITKNVAAIMISLLIIMIIIFSFSRYYKRDPKAIPKGIFQNMLEALVFFIRDDIAKPSIGEKKYEKFLPFLLTLFLFILFNNILGLIPIFPGGANVTGNIAVTMSLALLTFIITTINGNYNYYKHIFNTPGVPWWLKIPIPLLPIIELVGVFTKPFVLMVRLFANITAGHIIALGFFSLIFVFGEISIYAGYGISLLSVAFTIFMNFLELLVAFIQAYVFTLLSAIYFGMAVEEPHHDH